MIVHKKKTSKDLWLSNKTAGKRGDVINDGHNRKIHLLMDATGPSCGRVFHHHICVGVLQWEKRYPLVV